MSNFSIERQELFDAQYHVRALQMKAITSGTFDKYMKDLKTDSDESESLRFLLTTPPVLADMKFARYQGFEQEVHEKAAEKIRLIMEKTYSLSTLNDLVTVTEEDQRGTFDVTIDHAGLIIPPDFLAAFKRHPKLLNQAAAEGRDRAWITVLEVMQKKDTPLMRLRRDMAVLKGLEPSMGVNGGMTISQPTKVPKVDLRSYYPKDEPMPKLSFVVNPFE